MLPFLPALILLMLQGPTGLVRDHALTPGGVYGTAAFLSFRRGEDGAKLTDKQAIAQFLAECLRIEAGEQANVEDASEALPVFNPDNRHTSNAFLAVRRTRAGPLAS